MATPEQLGESRETFMRRVHGALEHAQTEAPTEAAPEVDEALVRLASEGDDLLAMFQQHAEAVGMQVQRTTQAAAAGMVCNALCEAGAHRIGVAAGSTGQQIDLEQALRDAKLELADWRSGSGMSAHYDLDAGITDVHAAMAETGTLVVCSGARHARGLSLAPPTHVALVRASDVLPDMLDYWRRLKGMPNMELPSSQVFITGPSKTADIEGELITGVHGPGLVHIVLIEDA